MQKAPAYSGSSSLSKKYLLPAKRAFEIHFLTQLCRVKKYFYPRKCLSDGCALRKATTFGLTLVCRQSRQTVRAAWMFGEKVPTGLFRRSQAYRI